jgi:hypothetical protein
LEESIVVLEVQFDLGDYLVALPACDTVLLFLISTLPIIPRFVKDEELGVQKQAVEPKGSELEVDHAIHVTNHIPTV